MSYGKIGPTTVAVTQDLLSGMPLVLKIELIRHWNSLLPEPGQPSAQLSKLIRLTACKKAMHAIIRGYRTVDIPWLVASYDTHKGKRWLNSNHPNHRFKKASFYFLCTVINSKACCQVLYQAEINTERGNNQYENCNSRPPH